MQRVQKFNKVLKENECEFINSTFLQLNIPNSQGYCSNNQIYDAKIETNTTIFCKYSCSNTSKLEFLRQQIFNNQFCNCGKCATVVNSRATSNLSNHLQIDIFLQPSLYARINFTDVKAISSHKNDCPSFISTTVDYFSTNNTNTNVARFSKKNN
uniref:Uncharacterized protein n=1 Tax=Panagrolaimus superbus TaxID=310955 RepID=A0A914ZBL1_9BILA